MADVQLARHRGRRGVDGEDLARSAPSGRSGRCPSSSQRADHFGFEAVERRSLGDHRGAAAARRGGRRARQGGVHGRVTVLRVLRLHDTATGTVRPLELRDAGRVSMYVCGPDGLRRAPPRARPASPWRSTCCAATSSSPASTSATWPTSPTSTTRSSTGPPKRGAPRPRWPSSTRRCGGRPWTPSGSAPHRHPPRHRVRAPHGARGRRPGGQRHGVRDERRRVPVGRPGRRLRPARPSEPRLAAGRRPGRAQRGEALARSTSCCGRRPSPGEPTWDRLGGRADPGGTPSAW